jgi:hypothetical protein
MIAFMLWATRDTYPARYGRTGVQGLKLLRLRPIKSIRDMPNARNLRSADRAQAFETLPGIHLESHAPAAFDIAGLCCTSHLCVLLFDTAVALLHIALLGIERPLSAAP